MKWRGVAARGDDGEARTDAAGQLRGEVGTGNGELARDPRSRTALPRRNDGHVSANAKNYSSNEHRIVNGQKLDIKKAEYRMKT